MSKVVCVVSGPTATGKTSISIELAKEFGGEIVNFDSLLFYKEISIGSAKPTQKEMQGVPHHLVGTQSILEPINAANFQDIAIKVISDIHQRGKPVFLVGGSGFYLQTLLNGMYKGGTVSSEVTERSRQLYQEEGITPFLEILKKNDIPSFERYHENDHYRICRAVEFFWHTGTPLSKQRELMASYLEEAPAVKEQWHVFHCYLDIPKEQHYEIIKKRSSQMIKEGLVQEVSGLLEKGYSSELKPLQSIGYKETIAYLHGEFENEEDYIERISISTRQLAKSQRTWFKKLEKNAYNSLCDRIKIKEDFSNFIKSLTV